jgi:hypothetical protein
MPLCGPVPLVAHLALPPCEAGSHVDTWPTRVAAPLALSLREADSHGVTWPCPHGDSLGSASLRGELPCCHVNPPAS